MVRRTRPNVTLYAHCLSCSYLICVCNLTSRSRIVISLQEAEYRVAVPRVLKLGNTKYSFARRVQIILCILVIWSGGWPTGTCGNISDINNMIHLLIFNFLYATQERTVITNSRKQKFNCGCWRKFNIQYIYCFDTQCWKGAWVSRMGPLINLV